MPAILHKAIPIFSTKDVPALLRHYATLGFQTRAYDDPDPTKGVHYGFITRDGIEIHLNLNPDHDPKTTAGCCFVHTDDADALDAEWRGKGGRMGQLVTTDYGMREGGHVDPDGNLIRFGTLVKS